MAHQRSVAAGAAVVALVVFLLAGPWAVALVTVTALWLAHGRRRRPARGMLRKRRRLSDEERRFVLDRDGWACVVCGSQENLELDHEIPFSRGGACSVDNLRTTCRTCNRRKGAR